MNGFQWRESNYFLVPVFICSGLHMFVDLNDNFSCQEFDRLLCNCSVKGCRENTLRKTTRLVCDVMLPATCVDKTDSLPIGITANLHMPRLIMVFTSFDAVILPLEKSGEVEQRDCHVCTRVVGTYIIRVKSSEGL